MASFGLWSKQAAQSLPWARWATVQWPNLISEQPPSDASGIRLEQRFLSGGSHVWGRGAMVEFQSRVAW
jgi:hypothetical protein